MIVAYRLYRFYRRCNMPRLHALKRAVGKVWQEREVRGVTR